MTILSPDAMRRIRPESLGAWTDVTLFVLRDTFASITPAEDVARAVRKMLGDGRCSLNDLLGTALSSAVEFRARGINVSAMYWLDVAAAIMQLMEQAQQAQSVTA